MEFLLVFLFGGLIYALLELLWRQRTHWTMLICGGVCFTLMYIIGMAPLPFYQKCILSSLGIGLLEFITGCIVNRGLHWGVWDYSSMPGNIMGQVCPQFMLLWLLLSVPGLKLCAQLRRIIPLLISNQ